MKRIFRLSFLAAIFGIAIADVANAQEEANIQQATEQRQQSFVERYNLPLFDCELKVVMGIKKITIIVPDDSTVVWVNAKRFEENASRGGLEVTVKTESQLQKSDFDSNLWIMGTVADYLNWDRFGIPVEKLSTGFKIGDFSFKDPLHGFSYVSSPGTFPVRLVFSGNTIEAYTQIDNMPSYGFEFVVMKDAVPELIGNGSHITNLNAVRKSHYTPIESKYYVFMISKNLNQEELEKINDEEIKKYDNHVEAFVQKMELNLPEKKVKTFIHATQEEIKYMSGWFGTLCENNNMNGFVTGEEIQSLKFSGFIEHEVNHHLFNRQVHKMAPTFLSEGIQKWYEYTVSTEEKEKGFQRAREFADEDLTKVICGNANFFQGDKYYLISGIFIDYLLDIYGLNKFKKLFRNETRDILSGFENTYDKPLPVILEEYKKWLLTKSNQ